MALKCFFQAWKLFSLSLFFFLTFPSTPGAWDFLSLQSGDTALEAAVPLGSYRNVSTLAAGLRGRLTLRTSLIPLLDPYLQTSLHSHAARNEGQLLDWPLTLGARWLLPLGDKDSPWALEVSGGYGMILHSAGGDWNRYITEKKVYADQLIEAEVILLRDFSWGPFFFGMNGGLIPQQSAPGFRLGLTGGYRFSLAKEDS